MSESATELARDYGVDLSDDHLAVAIDFLESVLRHATYRDLVGSWYQINGALVRLRIMRAYPVCDCAGDVTEPTT